MNLKLMNLFLMKTLSKAFILLLLLSNFFQLQSQNLVTYAGNHLNEQFNAVMQLSDGTFLVGGAASELDWIAANTRTNFGPATIDNSDVKPENVRYGYLLHISEDLQQILNLSFFPRGAVVDVRHIKTDAVPGNTGNIYISGTTQNGYFIAKLNNNYIGGNPSGLEWAWNVKASGHHQENQPWDVGGDGKVVFATGTPDGYGWAAVYRLKADGSDIDLVPHWRYHKGFSVLDGTPAEGMWTPAPDNPTIVANSSGVIFKTDTRCALRSWTPEDYNAVIADENGNTKQGQWPMDIFYAQACDRDRPYATMQMGGYTGYKKGAKDTHRIGAVAVDKRDNHIYIGASINSITNAGQPDFEPFVIAYTSDGKKKWWSRLYEESNLQSPPDQFVDALGIDYSRSGAYSSLLVIARQHGNAHKAFWSGDDIKGNPLHPSGTPTFHSKFTGTNGGIHLSWLGKMQLANGTLLYSSYIAGYLNDISLGGAYADPNLDGWPNHNAGWANLNTARCRINVRTDASGNVYTITTARAFVTTANAYQKHQKPQDGPSAWADNVRVYSPDLKTLVYSSALTGANPEAGSGGGNTILQDVWPVHNGAILVGYQKGDGSGGALGTSIPTANIPPWGTGTPEHQAAVLARLNFSNLEALFNVDPATGNCVGETSVFTDSSFSVGSTITQWEWDFGTGASPSTASGIGPHSITWASAGTKTVKLTVTDNLGNKDVTEMDYYVAAAPTDKITHNPATGSIGEAPVDIAFSPSTGVNANYLYEWTIHDFDGDAQYNEAEPTHTFNMRGEYLVSLKVTNGGCTVEDTLTIDIEEGPGPIYPAFEILPDPGCIGHPVVFQQLEDTNSVSWFWVFGQGAYPATAQTPGPHTVYYQTPGLKTALLTVSNGISKDYYHYQFIVGEPADAAFSFVGDTDKAPADITFSPDVPQAGLIYEWNFGDPISEEENTSEAQSPSHRFNQAGTYLVSLTTTTPDGCTNTYFDTVSIKPTIPEDGSTTPEADLAIVTSSHTCVFNTVTVTDMSRGYEDNNRVWHFEDDDVVIDDSLNLEPPLNSAGPINVYWTEPGTKRVTLEVKKGNGAPATVSSIAYVVHPYPNANFNLEGEQCSSPTTLDFKGAFGAGLHYSWDFGDGSPTVEATSPSHEFTVDGKYTVQLTVTNSGGCKSVVAQNVQIGNCPTSPSVTMLVDPARKDCASQRYMFEALTEGTVTSWDWDFGAAGTPATLTGSGPHEVLMDPGSLPQTVKLTVTFDDGSTETIELTIP